MKPVIFCAALFLIVLIIVLVTMRAASKKMKVVFAGDSITEQDIYGNGYINIIKRSLLPVVMDKYHFINAGVSGDRVEDLYARLEDDVIARKPAMTIVYIGINDVWKKIGGQGTPINRFENYYEAILKRLKEVNSKVAVCTLSVIGEKKNGNNALDEDLDEYSELIRKLSVKHSCTLIDLRNAFLQYENRDNERDSEYGFLTVDGVHLTQKGNELVADEMRSVFK